MDKKIVFLISFLSLLLFSSILFSGCTRQQKDDKNTYVRTFMYDGVERSYRIHIPPGFENRYEGSLLFVLHGGGGTAEGMEEYLTNKTFNRLSDDYGFIVVYPDGYEKHWNDGRRNVSWNASMDDVGFLTTLIDATVDEFHLNPNRVFFCGISNGGQMSYRIACEKTNKIAGIASVVSSMSEDLISMCSPSAALPVFIIAGTDDPLVPYEGGDITLFNKTYGRVVSVNQTVEYWVSHNHCNPSPTINYLPDINPSDDVMIRSEEYANGDNGSKVLLYVMEGGGHTWPGGPQYFPERVIGKTCGDLDACHAILRFFNITQEEHYLDDIIMKHNGYRPSWSYKSNLIAYDKKQGDGFYDIYTMKSDGSEEICLTDTSIFPAGHKGCAEWHPSDEYLVFTCQKEHYYGKRIPILRNMLDKLAVPGEGINCDLWIMDKNGSQCWQLTDLPTKKSYVDSQAYTGVIHPHFSHDGTKLFWSERIAGGGEDWGEWILRIAGFKVVDHIPMIENLVSYQPGVIPCFYESHGFSPDDSKIIFSGNLIAGQDVNHLDIYMLEMQTQSLVRLTTSEGEWDEHAHFSPDDQKIIWMSSEGYGMNTERDWWNYLRTEYWMMNHDGSNKTQISFYNDDIAETMRVICSDCSWSPDGKHLASTMLIIDNEVPIDGGIGILNVPK